MHDPVFLKALKRGVEVRQDSEVVGLITTYPSCGNDPCDWYTKRINLSNLAGFMDPDGIDDSIVDPDAIKDFKVNESKSLDGHGLPYFLMSRVSKVRQIYEASKRRVAQEPTLTRSFSREQVDH